MSKIDPSSFKHELTVGEVAERSGVAVSTIHFYEAKGLIKSRRSEGNQRRFRREVLRLIGLIKVAQNLGIPLAEIKKALSVISRDGHASAADWKNLSARWRSDLDERIERMTRLRNQLNSCIGCGCLSLKDCPLRNPWDKLSEEGSGPRLLE